MKTILLFAASLSAMAPYLLAETPAAVLSGYTAASSQSDRTFRGSSMNVDIVATVPRLEKAATLQGIRKVSGAGAVSYDSLQLSGDKSVRKEIIGRYLAAEENQNARDLSALALTPANYKFQFRGTEQVDGQEAHVFRVRPRHKREGAFDGAIWIDQDSHLPLRESGRLIAHSIFLRRLTLTRKFRIIDRRLAFPESTDVYIDTRLVGKAQMTVKLRDVSFAPEPDNLSSSGGANGPAVQ